METITVLPSGTRIQMTSFDANGYWGRDFHPSEKDVGFIGFVVGNYVDTYDAEFSPLETKKNVLGGTELVDDEDYSFADICYVVVGADGKKLELMNHEITKVQDPE